MGRLLEEFNVRVKNNNIELNDYNLFKDKDLLDTFRIKILEILSDKGFINENVPRDVINDCIDEVIIGYIPFLELYRYEKIHL